MDKLAVHSAFDFQHVHSPSQHSAGSCTRGMHTYMQANTQTYKMKVSKSSYKNTKCNFEFQKNSQWFFLPSVWDAFIHKQKLILVWYLNLTCVFYCGNPMSSSALQPMVREESAKSQAPNQSCSHSTLWYWWKWCFGNTSYGCAYLKI